MDSRLPWAWALLACWGKKTLNRCNKWNVKKTTLTTSKKLKGRGRIIKSGATELDVSFRRISLT